MDGQSSGSSATTCLCQSTTTSAEEHLAATHITALLPIDGAGVCELALASTDKHVSVRVEVSCLGSVPTVLQSGLQTRPAPAFVAVHAA